MRNTLFAVVPWLALCLSVIGCGEAAAGPDQSTIRFGAVIDQTGSVARPQWIQVTALAIDDANAGLELAGEELRFGLETSDSNNLVDVALQRGIELRDLGVKGLITDTSENALGILQTVYDANASNDVALPTVCMACTAPSLGDPAATHPVPVTRDALRNGAGWGFRTVAHARPEAFALLQVFLEDLRNRGDTNGDGQQKIAIEVINDLEGNEFLQDLRAARDALFPGIIIEAVRHEREVDVDGHNWNADFTQLSNDRNEQQLGRVDGRPDVLFETTFPLYAASLTRAYLEADSGLTSVPFVHHHNWRNDQILIKLGAFDLSGHEGVSQALVGNCETSGTAFWNAVEESLGREPGFLDAQTYDAVMSLALASLVALETQDVSDPRELTPAQVRDALHLINDSSDAAVEVTVGPEGFAAAVAAVRAGEPIDYVGASGPVDFDATGNVVGNFVKYRVEGGGFADIHTYDCVESPDCPIRAESCNP